MTSQLRNLALSRQGLSLDSQFGSGLSGTLSAIEHLGYVQIDTLSVVERAHHHILWSRVPNYELMHLNQLVSEQSIFEYWFHAASYLPMCDYRYALPRMMSIRSGETRYYSNIDKQLMNELLARIQIDGPLKIRDVNKEPNLNKGKNNWWNWGEAKRALDKLFMQGDLMICARNGMEKVYDLTERCLPKDINTSIPTVREYATYLFDTTLRAHGVFTWKQLLHLKTDKALQNIMREILNEHIEASIIIKLDNIKSNTYADINALEQISKNSSILKILSPFDNVLIHRDRLSSLFNFDYRIECYTPAPKRIFGYFCLPILYNDKLVGRVDCKAHRADQRFEIISLHLEDKSLNLNKFIPILKNELQKFANFNNCPLLVSSNNLLEI